MEEFKGMKGPWVASTSDRSIGPVCKDDDQSYGMIFPVAWVEFDGNKEHQQANANLIAAAPELLEALQKMIGCIEYYASLKESDQPNIEDWAYANNSAEVEMSRAAIAKALGK